MQCGMENDSHDFISPLQSEILLKAQIVMVIDASDVSKSWNRAVVSIFYFFSRSGGHLRQISRPCIHWAPPPHPPKATQLKAVTLNLEREGGVLPVRLCVHTYVQSRQCALWEIALGVLATHKQNKWANLENKIIAKGRQCFFPFSLRIQQAEVFVMERECKARDSALGRCLNRLPYLTKSNETNTSYSLFKTPDCSSLTSVGRNVKNAAAPNDGAVFAHPRLVVQSHGSHFHMWPAVGSVRASHTSCLAEKSCWTVAVRIL